MELAWLFCLWGFTLFSGDYTSCVNEKKAVKGEIGLAKFFTAYSLLGGSTPPSLHENFY